MAPFGTVVTFDEESPLTFSGLMWTSSSIDPAELTIGEGGAATVSSTLTNTVQEITGSFLVAKELVGIDPEELACEGACHPNGTTGKRHSSARGR